MLYFKNTDLAETYHVSLRTVLNWIEAAKEDKLALELYTYKDRQYVANTTRNISKIESIVEERKKYRNKRGYKAITPKPEFYELFTMHQLLDIVLSLDTYHEIPRQYNYFDGGADVWDAYAWKMASEQTPNNLNQAIKLLSINQSYIDDLLAPFERINLIDVGVGNAIPTKALLERLLAKGKLGRYIAIDISPQMLEIAERNIEEWFEGRVIFEGYQLDINYDRFTDLLAKEYLATQNDVSTANIALVLGSTLCNLRSPESALKVIQSSLGRNDLFIQTLKLDTVNSRRYFDFNTTSDGVSTLSPNHRLIFDLMNIDPSFYDVEMGYDERVSMRYIRIRLRVALSIVFDFNEGRRTIELDKGDTILLWRAWHYKDMDIINQLDQNGFKINQVSQTEDNEYILTIARIKSN
jgi:uncharacterized SAM-dependent methyltransferase